MSDDDIVHGFLCLSVDVEKYGSNSDVRQHAIQQELVDLLDAAGRRAGLRRTTWIRQEKGDEELSLVPATEPYQVVVGEFCVQLDAGLAELNRDRAIRLRLRLAADEGPLRRSALGYSGRAVVGVSRLVNSRPVRQALDLAPQADLAVILSHRVFQDWIRSGRSSVAPELFRQVPIEEKEVKDDAWLWVPRADVHQLALESPVGSTGIRGGRLRSRLSWRRRPGALLQLDSDIYVPRREQVAETVRHLVATRSGTAATPTVLHGEGGFGKSTTARMVCADPAVRRRFPGGTVPISLGPQIRQATLAQCVSEVIARLEGNDRLPGPGRAFTNPVQAGMVLCELLDGAPDCVVLVDDVWYADQLAPFSYGHGGWRILVTTRMSDLVKGAPTVEIDQMTDDQARAMLTRDAPGLSPAVVNELVRACGRWALLLENVNGQLRIASAEQRRDDPRDDDAGMDAFARRLIDRLRRHGPASLDVTDAGLRELAVRATLDASFDLPPRLDRAPLMELGIFTGGAPIPLELVADVWAAMDGLTAEASQEIVERAARRSLFRFRVTTRSLVIHDVVLHHFRSELGPDGVRRVSAALLDRLRESVPEVDGRPAWWSLPRTRAYLWRHLASLLVQAGRVDERDSLVVDPQWIVGVLAVLGPAALASDLADTLTPRADTLRRELDQSAHLLAATELPEAVGYTLLNRLHRHAVWAEPLSRKVGAGAGLRLRPLWPMVDSPHPALIRILPHPDGVLAVAVGPDGTLIATASGRTVRLWVAATGAECASLTGHTDRVTSLAVAPDGTWLASGGHDRTVRLWSIPDGELRATLIGHKAGVTSVAIAPDGSWLASAGRDQRVRLWAVGDGSVRRVLRCHTGPMGSVAISPDGTWLATGGEDATVRIWDAHTGRPRAILSGHTGRVRAMAVAPDGGSLISVGDDTVRVWDTRTGAALTRVACPLGGHSVVIARSAGWFAAVTGHGLVGLWDTRTGEALTTLTGHTYGVSALAGAPDDGWLASGGGDGTVRLWDLANSHLGPSPNGNALRSSEVAVAPDGSWVAGARGPNTLSLWETATGKLRHTLRGHSAPVNAIASGPDGSWLASSGDDGTIRRWCAATGDLRLTIDCADGVRALAVAPDGRWLASAEGHTIAIRDTTTGARLRAIETGDTMRLAIAPDGTWLVARSLTDVRTWDTRTGDLGHHIGTTLFGGRDVVVAPDGAWFAYIDANQVHVIDVRTGQAVATLPADSEAVWAVAAKPDGAWLVTVGRDHEVRLWEPTGRLVAMTRLDAELGSCAVDRHGRVVVGSGRGVFLFSTMDDAVNVAGGSGG